MPVAMYRTIVMYCMRLDVLWVKKKKKLCKNNAEADKPGKPDYRPIENRKFLRLQVFSFFIV